MLFLFLTLFSLIYINEKLFVAIKKIYILYSLIESCRTPTELMFELCDIENGCVMAGYDDAPIWNRSYVYTRTRRVIGVKEEKK